MKTILLFAPRIEYFEASVHISLCVYTCVRSRIWCRACNRVSLFVVFHFKLLSSSRWRVFKFRLPSRWVFLQSLIISNIFGGFYRPYKVLECQTWNFRCTKPQVLIDFWVFEFQLSQIVKWNRIKKHKVKCIRFITFCSFKCETDVIIWSCCSAWFTV